MAHATTKWGAIALIPGGALLALALRGRGDAVPVHNAAAVLAHRAAIPAPPGKIVPYGKGVMYAGGDDKAHVAWLADFLTNLAGNEPDLARRRGIMAFRALQGREGSTAAINTYDNQIVTWGTGWGGLGGLPKVLEHLSKSDAAAALQRGGFRYVGGGAYEVLNDKGERVHGKKEALEAVRGSPGLVRLLIHVARDPATRDDVALAQLWAFLAGSGRVEGQEEIATQALFNFASHLQHWAPGYARGGIAWAAQNAGGAGSRERDVRLAELLTQYFYTKARAKPGQWVPDWKQLRIYWNDMVRDGLAEAASHPYASAAAAPAEAIDVAGTFGQVTTKRHNAELLGGAIAALQRDVERLAPTAAYAEALARARRSGATAEGLAETIDALKGALERGGASAAADRLAPELVAQWFDFQDRWADFFQRAQAARFEGLAALPIVQTSRDFGFGGSNVDELLAGVREEYARFLALVKKADPATTAPPPPELVKTFGLTDAASSLAPGAGTLAVLGGVTVLGLWLAARR